jgi:plasmid replication initiation protein
MSTRHLIVVKANSLVEATYSLTLAEQRLLLLTISKLDSRVELDPRIPHIITACEIQDAFAVSDSQAYRILQETAETLYARSVRIYESDPAQPGSPYTDTRWVSTIRYQPGTGSVTLYFAIGILPFISQLRSRFCRYHLRHVAQMTSGYAIRLYEQLVQWRETGSRTVELTWLRERLDLGDKYPNIRDLKRWVLQPAIEQINTHSDLQVKWEQHKRGRVVHALTFTFNQKAEPTPPETQPASPAKSKPKLTREYVQQHAQPGESWEEAWERLRRKPEQETAG